MIRISLSTLALYISASLYVWAQVLPCPDKPIVTDSATSANPENSLRRNLSFNWLGWSATGLDENRRYQLLNANPTYYWAINTPFNTTTTPQISHFYFKQNQFHPNEGWELIDRRLGFDNTANRPRLGNGYNNPYFILYNKFTGTLRVFVIVTDANSGGQKLGINLQLGGDRLNKSLSYTGQLAPVVMSTDRANEQLTSLSLYNNSKDVWHYADFFIGYDPCVCLYSSDLQVRIRVVLSSTLQITGDLNGTITPMDLTASTSENRTLAGTQFFKNLSNVGTQGGEFFKSADGWLQKNKETLQSAGVFNAANSFINTSKVSKFLKAGFGALPVIGEVFDLFSSFVGGGASAGPSPVVITPMSIDARLNLNGTITQDFDFGGPSFSFPGSLNAGPGERYPYYNEPLGVFALLEKPKLTLREVYRTYGFFEDVGGGNMVYTPGTAIYQVKFVDSLNYVLNPSAQLEIQEMKVAVYRTDQPRSSLSSGYPGPNADPSIYFLDGKTNNNVDGQMERTRFTDAGYLKYSSMWIEQEYLYNFDPKVKIMLNLRRKDPFATDSTQNLLLVLTYDADVVSADPNFDWSSPDDNVPTTITLTEPPGGDSDFPVVYNFYATDSIVVRPNYPQAPGLSWSVGENVQVNFYTKKVNVYSGSGVFLGQGNGLPRHSDPIVTGPATSVQIGAACNSQLYRSSTIKKRPDEDDKPESTIEPRDPEISPLRLIPNPASDLVRIRFDQQQIGDVEVLVRDILGQPTLRQRYPGLLPNCDQQVELTTSALTPGVYIVTVTVDGRSHSERLLIQR